MTTVAGENKVDVLKRFLKDYEREVLLKMNPVKLVVVAFQENSQDTGVVNLLRTQVQFLEKEYPGFSFSVLERQEKFSRGLGLTAGLNSCFDTDLILILDVDISFTAKAFAE